MPAFIYYQNMINENEMGATVRHIAHLTRFIGLLFMLTHVTLFLMQMQSKH